MAGRHTHGNQSRERFRRHLKQFEVTMVIPPERLVEIAAGRVEGMVMMYVCHGRSGQLGIEDLNTLVRSAYLQGVRDMCTAAATLNTNPEHGPGLGDIQS